MVTARGRLADLTTGDVVQPVTVLVPLGSTEQHGPHLPLDVDSRIAERVAAGVGAGLRRSLGSSNVVEAPTLAYGSSGEHQGFAGTMSIGSRALHALILELARSLRNWAAGVIFVNGHGGNTGALAAAVQQLRAEGHDVSWIGCSEGWIDSHAGRTETSLMLALAPELVKPFATVTGNQAPLADLMPELILNGVHAVSRSGVLGNPAGANRAEGHEVLATMIADGVKRCRSVRIDSHGQRLA